MNECVKCKDGYTKVNGYCIPCAPCCRTCEPENGEGDEQCTSCHEGWGLSPVNSCSFCDPSCKTCEEAYNPFTILVGLFLPDTCTSCHEDSTLSPFGPSSV